MGGKYKQTRGNKYSFYFCSVIVQFENEWMKHTVFPQECPTGWVEGLGHVCGDEDQIPPTERKRGDTVKKQINNTQLFKQPLQQVQLKCCNGDE